MKNLTIALVVCGALGNAACVADASDAPVDEQGSQELRSGPKLPAAGIACTFHDAWTSDASPRAIQNPPLRAFRIHVEAAGNDLRFTYTNVATGQAVPFTTQALVSYGRYEVQVPSFVSRWGHLSVAAVAQGATGAWVLYFKPYRWNNVDNIQSVSFDCSPQ